MGAAMDSSAWLVLIPGSTATTGAWPSPLSRGGWLGVQQRDDGPLKRSPEIVALQGKIRRVRESVPFGGSDGLVCFSAFLDYSFARGKMIWFPLERIVFVQSSGPNLTGLFPCPTLHANPAPNVGAAQTPDRSRKARTSHQSRHSRWRDPQALSDIRRCDEFGPRTRPSAERRLHRRDAEGREVADVRRSAVLRSPCPPNKCRARSSLSDQLYALTLLESGRADGSARDGLAQSGAGRCHPARTLWIDHNPDQNGKPPVWRSGHLVVLRSKCPEPDAEASRQSYREYNRSPR